MGSRCALAEADSHERTAPQQLTASGRQGGQAGRRERAITIEWTSSAAVRGDMQMNARRLKGGLALPNLARRLIHLTRAEECHKCGCSPLPIASEHT